MTETIIVVDIETTGLSPDRGARATEVAAVKICDQRVVDTFHSLMNAGVSVPPEIQLLTGITNAMVRGAPPSRQVMARLSDFIGDDSLVAHNASFDSRFLASEFVISGIPYKARFACTMQLARRVYPNAPNHKLETLLDYAAIPNAGRFHRALADAMATADLLIHMQRDLCNRHGLSRLNHEQLCTLSRTPVASVAKKLSSWR